MYVSVCIEFDGFVGTLDVKKTLGKHNLHTDRQLRSNAVWTEEIIHTGWRESTQNILHIVFKACRMWRHVFGWVLSYVSRYRGALIFKD